MLKRNKNSTRTFFGNIKLDKIAVYMEEDGLQAILRLFFFFTTALACLVDIGFNTFVHWPREWYA